MALERSAGIADSVPVVVVNFKGRRAVLNLTDYEADPDKYGDIIEGPIFPARRPDDPVAPIKDPKLNADGVAIHTLGSPMHRA